MNPSEELATKADLAAAEKRIIEQVTGQVTAHVSERMIEMVRGIETSLLRAFHSDEARYRGAHAPHRSRFAQY